MDVVQFAVKKTMALIIIKKIILMMAASYQTAERICYTLTALRRNNYNLEYTKDSIVHMECLA